ncbi:MAG: hypothetical protein K0S33_2153 [Bacteroidetes bacterium]|jgi:hypothetical protein|nr:hypothetical protein [Bacteroidota bacterium]
MHKDVDLFARNLTGAYTIVFSLSISLNRMHKDPDLLYKDVDLFTRNLNGV